jgi:hypothetical protein
MAVRRNADLQRYLKDRYDGCDQWPDDDAGRDDLWLAVHSLTTVGKHDGEVRKFISKVAPWLTEHDTLRMLDRAYALPRPYSAAKLGQKLGLTDADRTRLKVRSIDAIDDPLKTKRAERARRYRVEWHKTKRREKGIKSREQWLAEHSITRDKPWIAAGYKSRDTWERHGKKPNAAGVTTHKLSFRTCGQTCRKRSDIGQTAASPPKPRPRHRHWDVRPTENPDVDELVWRGPRVRPAIGRAA